MAEETKEEIKLGMLPQELQEKLKKALKSGCYMVMVSYVDDTQNDDLQDYWMKRRYPTHEMIPTMENVIKDMKRDGKPHEHKITSENQTSPEE